MAKKRTKGNGEGTIYKYEKNGKTYWRGILTIGHDKDGKLIRKSFSGSKKNEVDAKMTAYKAKNNAGLLPSDDKITLQQWFYTWLFDFRVNDLKPSSFERYEGIYRNYINGSPIGKKKLSDLRAADIQNYYNTLLEEKTPNTIKTLNRTLKTCLNEALKQGYIPKNYCTIIKLPRTENKNEIIVFTVEEQKKLLAFLEGHKLKMLITMALGTGLRQGELLALKWTDIDFENNTVSVSKSIKIVAFISKDGNRETKTIEQTPKTKNSVRIIPIPDNIVSELKNYKEVQDQLKNNELYYDDNIVFADDIGHHLDTRYLLKRYTKILKDTKIPYKKFHTLRHTYATRLFELGVPIKTVQTLMGHSDIKTTMNIYTHVMPEEKNKAIYKLNKLF
ncbi:integrase [Clostridium sporogenes]|nr:site-specific integrase [Clostridium sporogenes]SUY60553.1 integrase [Clostridium sporogenes]